MPLHIMSESKAKQVNYYVWQQIYVTWRAKKLLKSSQMLIQVCFHF